MEATIRPPTTAAVITMTIAADAFTEGNAETSQDIRVSTSFLMRMPKTPTQLFTLTFPRENGLQSDDHPTTRILIAHTVDDYRRNGAQ